MVPVQAVALPFTLPRAQTKEAKAANGERKNAQQAEATSKQQARKDREARQTELRSSYLVCSSSSRLGPALNRLRGRRLVHQPLRGCLTT